MTTAEKLLMQIFERKSWIIEQAKKQAESYNQHLASKLAIDGIPPPSWLLSPTNSESEELSKEELISRLLCSHPQPTVCFSKAHYPLESNPTGTGDNSKFSDGFFTETLTSVKGHIGEDHPTVPAKSGEDDVGYTFKNVSEIDVSITSPGEQLVERILNIYSAPDPSLARIQRSKSRQKALELRSAKSLTKSGIKNNNVNDNFRLSIFSTEQVGRIDVPEWTEGCGISKSCKRPDLGKSDCQSKENDVDVYTGRVTRSRSCAKSPDFVGGSKEIGCTPGNCRKDVFSSGAKVGTRRSTPGLYCNPTDHSIQLQNSGPSTASFQSCVVQSLDGADLQGRDIENNVCTGNITRSEFSCGQAGDRLKGDCCYDNAQRSYNASMQFRDQLTANYAHGPSVSGANVFDEGGDTHQSNAGVNEKEMDFVPCSRMTRSWSYSQHNACVDETLHKVNISSHFNEADSGFLPPSNGRSALLTNAPSKEPGLVEPSFGTVHRVTRSKTWTNQDISNPVDCPKNSCLLGKISKFDLENKYAASDELLNSSGGQIISHCYETHYLRNEQQDADNAVGSELALCDLVDQSVSSGPIDTKQGGELESLVAQSPSAAVDPKELDVKMLEDYNLKTFTSSAGKKWLNNMSELCFHAVKLHLGHRHESLPVQHSEEGNRRGEGKSKISLVSNAGSNTFCSLDLIKKPIPESHDDLVEKGEMANPACDINDKIEQIHTEDYQVLPCFEVEGCGQHVPLGECGLMITSSNRSPVLESWPQLKRRKIKHQETNGHNTSPSGRMKKLHSIQKGSSTYLMNIEKDVDLLEAFRVTKNNDMESNELIDFNLTELESTSESHNGENHFCSKEQNEHKSSSTANEQSKTALVASLTKKKAGNSEGCYVERMATHSSSDHLDASDTDDKQCIRRSISLDTNILNISNCGNVTLDKSNQRTMPSEWKDGLQSQHLVLPLFNINQEYSAVDESLPVFEGFMVDAQSDGVELDFSVDEVAFDKLKLPRTTIERASILAKICKSASMDTPLSDFSSELELQGAQSLFNSVSNPNGLLESLDMRSTLPLNGEVDKQLEFGNNHTNNVKDSFERMPYPDCLPHSGAQYGLNSRNLHASPVGRFWERLSLLSGSSSEKRLSTNPNLTCFRIEEDPCVSEENETMDGIADDVQDDSDSLLANPCEPLKEMTNSAVVPHVSDSTQDDICRVDCTVIVGGKPIASATRYKLQQSLKKQTSSLGNTEVREKQTFSVGGYGLQKAKESICSSVNRTAFRSKSNLKRKEPKLLLKEPRKNNIVSNVNSFLPLVQQKQAASICAGKREVKVKALEAAEVAKRFHELRENERKIKREALKHERAKLEEHNLRHIELEKKKKEDERKKKDTDVIVKKRLREENARKEKEKKRMRFEERHRQREQDEKLCAKKAGKEKDYSKGEKMNSKDLNESKKLHNNEIMRREDAVLTIISKWAPTELVINHEECGDDSLESGKAMYTMNKSPTNEILMVQKSQEKSYEISPYQCSDDEEEEYEELPTKKYIPSWASKASVALLLPLQQEMNCKAIFPHDSFCCMDEVPLSRKLQ